jgi:hypothetical protein
MTKFALVLVAVAATVGAAYAAAPEAVEALARACGLPCC